MVAILNRRQFILVGIFWAGMIFGGWCLVYQAQIISEQYISGDDSFSQNIDQAVKELLSQNMHKSGLQRFEELKNSFPMVQALKLKRVGLDQLHVKFMAADPVCRLGSSFVLTRSNEVFLANYFSNAVLKNLPVIYLHTSPERPADIEAEQKSFLQQLPDFVLSTHQIHWYNLNKIILINKQNLKQQILIKYNQILTPALFVTCDKLITEYQTHTNKKCLETIKIDLRFEGQIIVSC